LELNMKKAIRRFFIVLIALSLQSCDPAPPPAQTGSGVSGSGTTNTWTWTGTGTSTNTNTSTNTGTGTGTNPPGSGATCYGNSQDGQGNGFAIPSRYINYAGHQSWLPTSEMVAAGASGYGGISYQEAQALFTSDGRLRVRFKVEPQYVATSGEVGCYGRETGQVGDQFNYTKLKFTVYLRDVQCTSTNGDGSCASYALGPRYNPQFLGPIDVNACSPIIELGQIRNASQYGTVVEVSDVRSDSTCQANGTYCPSDKIVRRASCWTMKVQIVTDYSQDFI
jgi:hypothetical protein